MKRWTFAIVAIALAAELLVGGAIAQSPSTDKGVIPPRSINLTAEQDHVVKEIILKDMRVQQVPRKAEVKIGDSVQSNTELQSFPPIVVEKVPQIRSYVFFVTENRIVIVNPQSNIVADIIE